MRRNLALARQLNRRRSNTTRAVERRCARRNGGGSSPARSSGSGHREGVAGRCTCALRPRDVACALPHRRQPSFGHGDRSVICYGRVHPDGVLDVASDVPGLLRGEARVDLHARARARRMDAKDRSTSGSTRHSRATPRWSSGSITRPSSVGTAPSARCFSATAPARLLAGDRNGWEPRAYLAEGYGSVGRKAVGQDAPLPTFCQPVHPVGLPLGW